MKNRQKKYQSQSQEKDLRNLIFIAIKLSTIIFIDVGDVLWTFVLF